MRTSSSLFSFNKRRTPFCSFPSKIASGPVKSALYHSFTAELSAQTTRTPRSCIRSIRVARFPTRAIFTCSRAPADSRCVVPVTDAERRSGKKIPSTCAPSIVRIKFARFVASCTSSRMQKSECGWIPSRSSSAST